MFSTSVTWQHQTIPGLEHVCRHVTQQQSDGRHVVSQLINGKYSLEHNQSLVDYYGYIICTIESCMLYLENHPCFAVGQAWHHQTRTVAQCDVISQLQSLEVFGLSWSLGHSNFLMREIYNM